jgi:Right handed beta helix region
MRKIALSIILLAFSFVFLLPAPAQAQATRTWVSGVGDDANPCSRTAPCKTFAGAISKTAAGGEISVLDPGGFGAVTITKAISLTNDGAGEAGVLVAGTNGIVVSAGVNDIINIRGIVIDGTGTGLAGIRFNSGAAVNIQNCVIKNFKGAPGTGITFTSNAASQLFVSDTVVSNNGGGILITTASAGSNLTQAILNRVQVESNGFGIKVDTTGGTGTAPARLTVRDSVAAGNSGNGIWSTAPASGAANSLVMIDRTAAVNNATGVLMDGGNSAGLLNNSVVTGNNIGVSFTNGAALQSYKNNAINFNNVTDGTPSSIVTPE